MVEDLDADYLSPSDLVFFHAIRKYILLARIVECYLKANQRVDVNQRVYFPVKLSRAVHELLQDLVFSSLVYQSRFSSRLDVNKLICNTDGHRLLLEPSAVFLLKRYKSVVEFKSKFGLVSGVRSERSRLERAFYERLSHYGAQIRVQSLRHRLSVETLERCKQGWFLVFNTLTVSSDEYDKVFSRGDTTFIDYVRRVDRAIARSVFGSFRLAKRSGEPYHTYFAVVERGGRSGRLHIHILHFCRCLPVSWCVDPNKYAGGVRRELTAMKDLWSSGHSSPIAVRYSHSDAYGKRGFHYPSKRRKDGLCESVRQGSPLMVSSYVSKYITKAMQTPSLLGEVKKENWLWRTRLSRNLGCQLVDRLLLENWSLMPKALSGALTSCWKVCRQVPGLPIPPRKLVKQRALRLMFRAWLKCSHRQRDQVMVFLAHVLRRERPWRRLFEPRESVRRKVSTISEKARYFARKSVKVLDFEADLRLRMLDHAKVSPVVLLIGRYLDYYRDDKLFTPLGVMSIHRVS